MRRVLALAFLFLVALPSVLRAQSTNASLTGRITDPSKAAISDAKLAAIRVATNIRYETTTNASGEYYLTNLPPGLYQIEIEKTGFKKLIKPDVILHVMAQFMCHDHFHLFARKILQQCVRHDDAPRVPPADNSRIRFACLRSQ